MIELDVHLPSSFFPYISDGSFQISAFLYFYFFYGEKKTWRTFGSWKFALFFQSIFKLLSFPLLIHWKKKEKKAVKVWKHDFSQLYRVRLLDLLGSCHPSGLEDQLVGVNVCLFSESRKQRFSMGTIEATFWIAFYFVYFTHYSIGNQHQTPQCHHFSFQLTSD